MTKRGMICWTRVEKILVQTLVSPVTVERQQPRDVRDEHKDCKKCVLQTCLCGVLLVEGESDEQRGGDT